MFARIVFLLLLALNIGVACWLYFAPQSSASQLPATDRGVPKLVLLSEQEEHSGRSERGGTGDRAGVAC
jgi:hypothetical protein